MDLPDIPNMVRISKAVAMLDAILCEDWESRYYSFNCKWSPANPQRMLASMRDGCGDEYFIWFAPVGAAIKGFAHESPLNPANGCCGVWPGVLAKVPRDFDEFLHEPAFEMNFSTFCFWRAAADTAWHKSNVKLPSEVGSDPDGSARLLQILDGKPSTYIKYAADYFEKDLDENCVDHIYALESLSSKLLSKLGSERSLEDLEGDIAEIGYTR